MQLSQESTSYTLVVVDMQPKFRTSRPVLEEVAWQVRLAKAAFCPVVFLQYKHFGPTCARLFDLVESNPALYAVYRKGTNDGSAAVHHACQSRGFATNRFRLVGVNTHACVKSTALGLSQRFANSIVEVATQACNDWRGNHWDRFPTRPNIRLLYGCS